MPSGGPISARERAGRPAARAPVRACPRAQTAAQHRQNTVSGAAATTDG